MESNQVYIQEVGPRDGFQNERVVLPPEVRAHFIDRLVEAGLKSIQVGSFVNPKLVPQMADTDKVLQLIRARDDVRYSVLILSRRGLDSAIAAGVRHIEIYVSASETHSLRNSGQTVGNALDGAFEIIRDAKAAGITVTAGVMCAFDCFYEGAVSVGQVGRIVEKMMEASPDEIGLADTAGLGTPAKVRGVVSALLPITGIDRLLLHLHDTHGHGESNVRTAIELGLRRFDSSIGALGGCPFLPGATGNIATERVAAMLDSMGFQTGIELKELDSIRTEIFAALKR